MSLKSVDEVMETLGGDVRSPDETQGMRRYSGGQMYVPAGLTEVNEAGIDQLFGPSKCYHQIRNESPTHRLVLWMTINGHKPKEVATALRINYITVLNLRKQPWFQEALCKILEERGGDQLETLLQGEVVATIETLVKLRDTGETDAVKLAATKEILDRIRGKPTVHVKQEVRGQIDNVVYDAAALMEEQKRNAEALKARGIGTN
jgi:hypothetical protein